MAALAALPRFFRPACPRRTLPALLLATAGIAGAPPTRADSVNSPNITLNVDTNRTGGPGAGNAFVTISTITIAEVTLPEYSSGGGQKITLKVRPGYQFDPGSPVTAQSATIGLNGGGVNTLASVVPSGAADEEVRFDLTSGTDPAVQDIIRINGVKLRIISAAGAAGPAQTTLGLTTSSAGGAFTNQGIVAANITRGAADRLVFAAQLGTTQADANLLPAVKIVDFGGNTVTGDDRPIALALQSNPGSATLLGTATVNTAGGVATWTGAEQLRLQVAAAGYVFRATHGGASFLTSNSIDSAPFDITGGAPRQLVFSTQPTSVAAGADILVAVRVLDEFNNVSTAPVDVTLDAGNNSTAWPLLVDSSLTKTTVGGTATWNAADHLRINSKVSGYRLLASGVGAPAPSTTFNVVAGPDAILRFFQQPGDVLQGVGISPPVGVEIVDQFGNRTDSTAKIELVLGTTCGGTLNGANANTAAGAASFDGLSIDTPCANDFLEARSGTLVRDNSSLFNVAENPDFVPTSNGNNNANANGNNNGNANANANANANNNADDAGGLIDNVAPQCGACGQGALAGLAPALLLPAGAGLRRRWKRR